MKQIQKNKYWNIPLGQGAVTTQATEAWKPLQPSSRWSLRPQAFWRASATALLEVYQRKKLKGCEVQLQPWPLQSHSGPYWQQIRTGWSILFTGLRLLLFSGLTAPRWHLHYLIWRRILTRDTRTSRREGKEEQMGACCYLFSFHKSYEFMVPHRQNIAAREL